MAGEKTSATTATASTAALISATRQNKVTRLESQAQSADHGGRHPTRTRTPLRRDSTPAAHTAAAANPSAAPATASPAIHARSSWP